MDVKLHIYLRATQQCCVESSNNLLLVLLYLKSQITRERRGSIYRYRVLIYVVPKRWKKAHRIIVRIFWYVWVRYGAVRLKWKPAFKLTVYKKSARRIFIQLWDEYSRGWLCLHSASQKFGHLFTRYPVIHFRWKFGDCAGKRLIELRKDYKGKAGIICNYCQHSL